MTNVAQSFQDDINIIQQAMLHAVAWHRAGRLAEAIELYKTVLLVDPQHADANHNLGVLLAQQQNIEDCLPYLYTALEIEPTVSQYWFSYLDALLLAGHVDDARLVLSHGKAHGLHGETLTALEVRAATL